MIDLVSDLGDRQIGFLIWTLFARILAMKKASIQTLKADLSALVAEAEAGETILVTRHHKPVAQLGPARPEPVHRGARVGAGRLEPVVKRGTGGRYLSILRDDRGDR